MPAAALFSSQDNVPRRRPEGAHGGGSRGLAILLAFALAALAPPAPAAPASAPTTTPHASQTVLSIATATGTRHFDLAALEAMGMRKIRTRTFWPADDGAYQGPLLADVLKRAGIEKVPAIRVTALDGFSQIIPREDWSRWPLLLATRREGKPLSTRDKGPLRLIYPRNQDPVLEDTLYRLRWVWLVRAIEPVHGH